MDDEGQTENSTALSSKVSGAYNITSSQPLQAGQYWRAARAPENSRITDGVVLLIAELRYVEGKLHTVVLQNHPDWPNADGKQRLLADDFLARFEYEPDGKAIRALELRAAHDRVTRLETEMREGQADPSVVAAYIEERLSTEEKAIGPSRSLPNLSEMSTELTAETVEQYQALVKREHKIATLKAQWLQGKSKEIAQAIEAMTPYFEEQAAAALASVQTLREDLDKLSRGIATLDLYVGKGVTVTPLASGTSADETEPLTVMQKKLCLDEELAVNMDLDEWFDFRRTDQGLKQLAEASGLIERVLPFPRSIAVMATTRRDLDYKDRYDNVVLNELNHSVFLIVRDGQNLYRVDSGVESHLGTARLFPTKDEQDRVFRGFAGEKINFKDLNFTDALNRHEEFATHYKRFLVLLAGLDHRLNLFGTFYPGPKSMRFVSEEFQIEHMRFIADDDASRLLDDDRPGLFTWIETKNKFLRSGSRVVAHWYNVASPDNCPGMGSWETWGSGGRHFYRRVDFLDASAVLVVYLDRGELCVDIPCEHKVSGKRYNVRLSLDNLILQNAHQLPFLVLDDVEPEELDFYMHDRRSLASFLHYASLFRAARTRVRADHKAETATRATLLKALNDASIGESADRPALVGRAVAAWRAAHRGAPLPDWSRQSPGREYAQLLDQMYSLARGPMVTPEAAQAVAEVMNCTPLRLVTASKGQSVLYAAAPEAERDDRLEPHRWVKRIVLSATKRSVSVARWSWDILPEAKAAETTAHEWPTAKDWAGKTSAFGTFTAKIKLFEMLDRGAQMLNDWNDVSTNGRFEEYLTAYTRAMGKSNNGVQYVQQVHFAVPFGALLTDSNQLKVLFAVNVFPAAHLHHGAPEERKYDVRRAWVGRYQNKTHAEGQFQKNLVGPYDWAIGAGSLKNLSWDGLGFTDPKSVSHGTYNRPIGSLALAEKLYQSHFTQLYLAPWAVGEIGALTFGGGLPEERLDSALMVESSSGGYRYLDALPPGFNFQWNTLSSRRLTDLIAGPSLDGSRAPSIYLRHVEEDAAQAAVAFAQAKVGFEAKLSTENPELPQVSDGRRRWYIVKTAAVEQAPS